MFANSSFVIFMVLISCWCVSILSLQYEIQVRPHLCRLLSSRRVLFPPFQVIIRLLGRGANGKGVGHRQPPTASDATGLRAHNWTERNCEVELLASAAPSSFAVEQLASGTWWGWKWGHRPLPRMHAIQTAFCASYQSNFTVQCPICACCTA